MQRRTGGVVLIGVTALVWVRSLWGDFVWDDLDNLLYGDRLKQWSSFFEVFLHDAMWSANKAQATIGTYRPLSLATFVVDLNLFGPSAPALHLTSVLYHLAATGIVYSLFSRWMPWQAALAITLPWALHPNHAEAVAWVNGRSEVLALIFGGGAALLVSRRRIGPWALLGAFAGLTLAMLGKESGLVFVPVVVFLAGEATGAARDPRWYRRMHAPTVLAAVAALAVYAALRQHALEGGAAAGVALNATWPAVTEGPALLAKCTQVMAWPYEISVNHLRRWLINASPWWRPVGGAVVIAQLGAALWLWRRNRRVEAFGWLWWLGSLIPVALIGVLGWPGLHRWLYMGSPGLAWGLYGLWREAVAPRVPLRASQAALAVVCVGLAVQAQRAITVWWTGDRLFGAMVDEHPDVAFGYIGLGAYLLEHERFDEAERVLRRSTELDVRRNDGFFFLSRTLAAKGDCAGAVAVVEARTPGDLAPGAAWGVGKCYADKRGDHANAYRYFKLCETHYTDCSEGVAKAIELGVVPDSDAPPLGPDDVLEAVHGGEWDTPASGAATIAVQVLEEAGGAPASAPASAAPEAPASQP